MIEKETIKKYKAREEPKQVPGLKLIVGEKYRLVDKIKKKEQSKTRHEGKIIEEFERYYLGISEKGYKFTIDKQPMCWEVKRIS